MKIGIELAIKTPVNEIEQAIKLCEKHNLDRIWIPDSNISLWEFWSILGLTANVSNNIRIGAGVTSPYQRNPVVMAQAAATIDQLSNGRLDMALGRGSRFWLSNIGIDGVDDGLNESFEILKSLFAGNELDYSGNQFNIKSPALRQSIIQETIPIYIANTSEYWTEKAIKFADGIHTYTTNKNLLNYMNEASNKAIQQPFYKITTIGYIQPKEVETWWVSNFAKNRNLQLHNAAAANKHRRRGEPDSWIAADAGLDAVGALRREDLQRHRQRHGHRRVHLAQVEDGDRQKPRITSTACRGRGPTANPP